MKQSTFDQFAQVLDDILVVMIYNGWRQVSEDSEHYYVMPNVPFAKRIGNVNYFDSKVNVCWKFIALAKESQIKMIFPFFKSCTAVRAMPASRSKVDLTGEHPVHHCAI